MTANKCGACRNCCQGTLIQANRKDIKRWKQEQRYDIILCLERWPDGNAYFYRKGADCIFLREEGCEIYETRPEMCKQFPKTTRQIAHFNCRLTPNTHEPST